MLQAWGYEATLVNSMRTAGPYSVNETYEKCHNMDIVWFAATVANQAASVPD